MMLRQMISPRTSMQYVSMGISLSGTYLLHRNNFRNISQVLVVSVIANLTIVVASCFISHNATNFRAIVQIALKNFITLWMLMFFMGAPLLNVSAESFINVETALFALHLTLKLLLVDHGELVETPKTDNRLISGQLQVILILAACWVCSVFSLMDWEKPYQTWPIPNYIGSAVGQVMSIILMLMQGQVIKDKQQ
ncbi:hypothetical protein MIR68_012144 [Amoeboaphelidium protococcarum]|nr:hypothetical protein MIR68_012144 [Amoeboaphelidium protococcarum]